MLSIFINLFISLKDKRYRDEIFLWMGSPKMNPYMNFEVSYINHFINCVWSFWIYAV